MRPTVQRRRLTPYIIGAALLGLALVMGVVVALRTEPARAWLRSLTGEENVWEGAKGVVTLAMLDLTGPELRLEPLAVEAHADVTPYGVNTFLQLEPDPAVVRRSFELMRDAGIGWARQHFPWEDIEIHGPSDFEDRRNDPARSAWDKYDRIVQLSADYGVQLLGRLDDPPTWAYDDPDAEGPQMGPPSDLATWSDFVTAVVGRYCGRMRYWQLWNEPNIYPEWGERDVDPAGYAELLAVGATAARAACDDVVIVSAALAQTTETGGRNMDDLIYLERLYQEGWDEHFDVLAVQAFGLWTGPTDRRISPERVNFGRLLLARDIMVNHGDAAKAMWITEFGWNSAPEEMNAPYGRVPEDIRGQYTAAAYERIASEWPFVGTAFLWYLRRPDAEWLSRPEGWFRLVDSDWIETPSMVALRDLGLRPLIARGGRQGVSHPAMTFSGPWRTVPPEAESTPRLRVGSVGAELQFPFRGTGFHLEVDQDPAATDGTATELFVVLDGEGITVNLDPADGGFGQDDLADEVHTLIVRVDSGQLPLSAIVVDGQPNGNPLRPLYAALIALLALATLVAAALWRIGRRGRRATGRPSGKPSADDADAQRPRHRGENGEPDGGDETAARDNRDGYEELDKTAHRTASSDTTRTDDEVPLT